MTLTTKKASLIFNIMGDDGSYENLRLDDNFHIEANIEINPMSTGSTLACSVYGLSKDKMNHLSLVGNVINSPAPSMRGETRTNVTLLVGESGGSMQVIFAGNVVEGWAEYNGGDPSFHFQALTISIARATMSNGISFPGQNKTFDIISYVCRQMGMRAVNHEGWEEGDHLNDVVLSGTLADMLDDIMQAKHGASYAISRLNSDTSVVDDFGVVHVYGPLFKGDRGTPDAIISKQNGLIGYPQYSIHGLRLKCLLRPELTYNSIVQVKSDYIPFGWKLDRQAKNAKGQMTWGANASGQFIGDANKPWDGKWLVLHASHEISTRMPYGNWFTYLECQLANIANGYQEPYTQTA